MDVVDFVLGWHWHAAHATGSPQCRLSQIHAPATRAHGITIGIDGLVLIVRLPIEVAEQIKEDDRVAHKEEGQRLGHVAALGAHGQHIAKNEDKLNQLNAGHVLLPPQILLVLRSHGGDHIVEIHNDMHTGVENANDDALFAGRILQIAPREEHCDRMMVDVQERDLIVLLAQHKERGVQQIDDLREEVEPGARIESQVLFACAVDFALLRQYRCHDIALLKGLQAI